jgi:hypothetical protein
LEGTRVFRPDVFINYIFLLAFARLCEEELKEKDSRINVDKWLVKGFAKWFMDHVSSLAFGTN